MNFLSAYLVKMLYETLDLKLIKQHSFFAGMVVDAIWFAVG